MPPANHLRIHTSILLDGSLAHIGTYVHGAEALDLDCKAAHVPDLQERLVTTIAPSFATLRHLRLLHNSPLEMEPTWTDGVCHTSGRSLVAFLPQFEVLMHLHTDSSYLTPDALRNLPPMLEHLHVDLVRSGSAFCDPEAALLAGCIGKSGMNNVEMLLLDNRTDSEQEGLSELPTTR